MTFLPKKNTITFLFAYLGFLGSFLEYLVFSRECFYLAKTIY